jgi:cathepsin L
LPAEVDWRKQGVVTKVKNQGSCGSCWAFSTTAVLESHIAIQERAAGRDYQLQQFSEQQLVDCTPNPHKCGGTGGCHGATQELGFDYVSKNGIVLEQDYTYNARENKCVDSSKTKVASIESFVKLPENDYNALMQAVANYGPIAVSVAADDWVFYSGGVFNGDCGATINHAVTLVGYGIDEEGNNYWLVRNSWGEGWGEQGYIRVAREKSAHDVHCEIDYKPADGTGCEGGPSQITVCGKCGILSDSSYPVGGKFKSQ